MKVDGLRAPLPSVQFPGCTHIESTILQLRARNYTFRQISSVVGYAPRRVSDMYFAAMAKIINYLETDAFLRG